MRAPRGFRTFLVVWATQSASTFGTALTIFSLQNWLAQTLYARPEQQGALTWALAAVSLGYGVPMAALAPLAGVWADRFDRRRIMLVMDTCSGVLSLLLLALAANGQLALWVLLAIVILLAVCSTFHQAALESSVVLMVPKAQLPRANGMMATILSLSGILAPGTAAAILALPALARQGLVGGGVGVALGRLSSGMPLAVGIDSATFFVAALALAWVRFLSPTMQPIRAADDQVRASGPLREAWAGARYISSVRLLFWLLVLFAVNAVAGVPLSLYQPLLVKFSLAADWTRHHMTYESALALLTSVGSTGGVVGGFCVSVWGSRVRNRALAILWGTLAAGAAEVVFGWSHALYLSAAMLFVTFATGPTLYALAQSIWQTETPPELQGRVFAVRRLVQQGMWPIATLLGAAAGSRFSPGAVAMMAGVGLIAFAWVQLANPAWRRSHAQTHEL